MTRAEGRRLVALRAAPAAGFESALRERREAGDAVLPLPSGLPDAELARILAHLRPHALIEGRRETRLDGAAPVAAATDLVVLTSGSTGRPKGVEIARRALAEAARLTVDGLGCSPGDRWLCCVPVTRIAGLAILARSELLGSSPVVLEPFDVDAVSGDDSCAYLSLVPTMLHRLVEAGAELSRWKAILLGGAAAPRALIERAGERGARIVRTYGMTETCGGVVYDGRPLAGVHVAVDEDSVIRLASPTLMERYRCDDTLTRRVLRDGWYRTGDVGEWDGERLRVVGRVDGAIVSGGEKVFPAEVEEALLAHPAVRSARVRGEPDDEWGERVVARVKTTLHPDDVRAFLKERLARHKVPARIELDEG